ncbi:MAG: PH domain-containing protein [Paludibacter sp.]|jgi:hypothetical protein|nr:PH domain-containing protein [Paludibacter sp.]
MQIIKQKVNWSASVIVATIAIGAVLLATEFFLIRELSYKWDDLIVFAVVILALVVLYFAAQSPISIVLTDKQLELKKLLGSTVIKRSDIKRIDTYVQDNSDVRKFGSGGFCGYIGIFANAKIGNYNSYVCNYDQTFLVQTFGGKNYVFSCQNNDLIINELKRTKTHIK